MHRKQFIASAVAAIPAAAFANKLPRFLKDKKPFKVDADLGKDGKKMFFGKTNLNNIKISRHDTDNQVSFFEYVGYEKIGPALHIHLNQDEVFYVVDGRYRFVVGDQTMELKAGETIFLPRGIAHTWIQLSDRGRMVYYVTPAGKMEDFFIYLSNLKAPPTPQEMDKIHADHDMKVVGPPLTLS